VKSFRVWDEIVDPANVWRAWREFASGKQRRPRVAELAIDAPSHVLRLANELAFGDYRPGSYRLIKIRDPKRRVVAAAPVRDRIVHHALHRVLAPRLNRSFSDQSYACLEGRGSHRAVLRFRGELRRYRWVLSLDIRRYFYSVDRAILRALLFRRLPEPKLRGLLGRIIASGAGLYDRADVVDWLGWDQPNPTGRGLPIGNLTSQWWGNLYLDGLDHYAQRVLRVPSYQRYMDDFTLFANGRSDLLGLRDRIANWLREQRSLELKDPGARPRRCSGSHLYLGYRVSPGGIEPGPRMRARAPALIARRAGEPEKLRASLAALRACWEFG